MSRFPANAGIAIGPILFILALLGMIVSFMASSSSGFNVAGAADRVNADIVNQANLIRTKGFMYTTRLVSLTTQILYEEKKLKKERKKNKQEKKNNKPERKKKN